MSWIKMILECLIRFQCRAAAQMRLSFLHKLLNKLMRQTVFDGCPFCFGSCGNLQVDWANKAAPNDYCPLLIHLLNLISKIINKIDPIISSTDWFIILSLQCQEKLKNTHNNIPRSTVTSMSMKQSRIQMTFTFGKKCSLWSHFNIFIDLMIKMFANLFIVLSTDSLLQLYERYYLNLPVVQCVILC